jgi:hypothetical protein
MSTADPRADYNAGTGEWACLPLRVWLAEDIRRTLRSAEQHALNHPDGAGELLRELGYLAGLLSWHLDKHRTQLTNTPTTKDPSS